MGDKNAIFSDVFSGYRYMQISCANNNNDDDDDDNNNNNNK